MISSVISRGILKVDIITLLSRQFPVSRTLFCCHQHTDFIDTTVLAWVSQVVIKVYGKVGVCSPPHLVLPLTVEPSKPRLCHDERFLNLWVRDLPFKLDHLPDLPRYVLPGHFQTTFDDKNG